MHTLRPKYRSTGAILWVAFLAGAGNGAAQNSGPVLTTLYAFQGPPTDGYSPQENLAIGHGPAGQLILYGVTSGGGSATGCIGIQGCGTVYSVMAPSSPGGAWTEMVLHNFTSGPADGALPVGTLAIRTTTG